MAGSAAGAKASAGLDGLEKAHARLLQDSAIQFDLPRYTMPKTPQWLLDLLHALSKLGPVLRFLFWAGLAVLVALLLYFAFRYVRARFSFRHGEVEENIEEWRPEAGPARALLLEADMLAASGHYAEAAHLLLWRSIEDIEARRPELLKPALTSRDIAEAGELPEAARTTFGTIARIVERSLFGKRDVDAADWSECRSAYERFAFAGSWA